MNNILIVYEFFNSNKFIIDKFIIFLTTFITLFNFGTLTPIKAQTITKKSTPIIFYGSEPESTVRGKQYIVFQTNNDLAQGLVYVQNSDVFSCFQGTYDRQNESFEELIFAYPEIETNEWIESKSEEKMSLNDFPHQLNEFDIDENTQKLFNECINFFKTN